MDDEERPDQSEVLDSERKELWSELRDMGSTLREISLRFEDLGATGPLQEVLMEAEDFVDKGLEKLTRVVRALEPETFEKPDP